MFDSNPIEKLRQWTDDAAAAGVKEPGSMCLATVGAHGRPSARFVLVRGIDERGLRFYTSYFSRKARELAENPHAAGVFHWHVLERQVRVEGEVEMLSEEESDEYFASRPRGHQLAAWASEQSEPIESYEVLEARYAHFEARFADDTVVPRPHSWGGYVLKPSRFEFWLGRPNRMHDRIECVLHDGVWRTFRLQP
ncbi:MAG: pyridoxamine 5'-phosphate oxidase [Candidatus Eremiobacteraeota bacterium]|nr:pyridoxamine 5'-phosphate oxidase [Candidatus Eremiobacteraeota bacterium]